MTVKRSAKTTVFYILASWFVFVPCHAKGNMETRRLIQASRMDSLAILVIPRSFYPRASPSDPHLLEATACLASAKGTGFVEILADPAEKIMSPEEIRAAHLFFESPTGRRYADLTIWQARDELELAQLSPAPQFSKKEEEQIAHFVKTSGGIKLRIQELFVVSQTAGVFTSTRHKSFATVLASMESS